MSWRMVTLWEWCCDGCKREHTATDDLQPEGWIHTQDGRDLCRECAPW